MKWKVEIIALVTLFGQMGFLFYSWWNKWLTSDATLFYAAAIFVIIGCIGGAIMWQQKQRKGSERPGTQKVVRWVGAVLATVGIYIVFVPVVAILTHGGIEAFLLVFGVFAPTLLSKLPPLRGAANNV